MKKIAKMNRKMLTLTWRENIVHMLLRASRFFELRSHSFQVLPKKPGRGLGINSQMKEAGSQLIQPFVLRDNNAAGTQIEE